ncbi:hypothetical protein O5623_17685 [Escherichia coli]|nr:hypothetical protein [Escherichia coli]
MSIEPAEDLSQAFDTFLSIQSQAIKTDVLLGDDTAWGQGIFHAAGGALKTTKATGNRTSVTGWKSTQDAVAPSRRGLCVAVASDIVALTGNCLMLSDDKKQRFMQYRHNRRADEWQRIVRRGVAVGEASVLLRSLLLYWHGGIWSHGDAIGLNSDGLKTLCIVGAMILLLLIRYGRAIGLALKQRWSRFQAERKKELPTSEGRVGQTAPRNFTVDTIRKAMRSLYGQVAGDVKSASCS